MLVVNGWLIIYRTRDRIEGECLWASVFACIYEFRALECVYIET